MPMLQNSNAWTHTKEIGLQSWFKEYYQWLTESSHGQEERIRPNNHGTWYDVQCISILLYLERASEATLILQERSKRRIDGQIQADGAMPLEIERGFSLHYSLYNVRAFLALVQFGKRLEVDLWNYRGPEGQSIPKAFEYLMPYIGNQDKWPHKDKGRSIKDWAPICNQVAFLSPVQKHLRARRKSRLELQQKCSYSPLIIPFF
jgi:hypothetical protein